MQFRHQFQIRAPLAAVQRFHRDPQNLVKLTPPPVRVKLIAAPDPPRDGAQMSFVLSLGPLSIPWTAVFSEVGDQGFVDSQLIGPFQRWVHRHNFRAIDGGNTEILDHITAEIGLSSWAPIAAGFWLGLPFLFRHRARLTRGSLEGSGPT
jgi:ligand-binding SRPBCC domain-containing protein